jgi:RNA polymerase sigma factor (sigma-70 family)
MGEMHDQSDIQLLRQYAENGNEASFREIVVRHTGCVYGSALRQVSSPDLARDVAQSVFTALARKSKTVAQSLDQQASLIGWLYRSTRFAALNQLRDDRRRQSRERQVMEQFDSASESTLDWDRVQPVLDEAMADLSDEDREALLLRFFKSHDFRSIGQSFGVSDDAAQKRVSRALERLRAHLTKRGVTASVLALSTVLSANAATVAPAGLAATLSTAALAGTTLAATAATITTHSTMNWLTAKAFTGILAASLAAGTGTYLVQQHKADDLRVENQNLVKTQQQLTSERDAAVSAADANKDELERLRKERNELVRLRGEVNSLRKQTNEVFILREQNRQLQVSAKTAVSKNQAAMLAEADLARRNACINNLRQIDGAKQQYALENKLTATDFVTSENIQPYFHPRNGKPVCPSGGTYTLGRLDAAPTCSIPGHSIE